jgi:hypothetical protein
MATVPLKLIKLNDQEVAEALELQVRESGSRHAGGIRNRMTGIPSPSHVGTASYMASMGAALVLPESRYYRDAQVIDALDRAADYMLRKQHADGTISLGSTNFHSPPDTGFVVNGFVQLVRLLADADDERIRAIADKLRLFLERTIPAMLTGGCHTPNHRWVMTAALASLYDLFGMEELVRRADEWLAEGMDCTLDGEWTERSNGIYNTVSDIMLFYAATYLRRPHLLDYVRRNLKMMRYLLHANGEVVTDYSGRQDYGVVHDLSGYYLVLRVMASLDRDPLLATMHDLALEKLTDLGPVNHHALLGSLIFPSRLEEVAREPLPDEYAVILNEHHPVERDLERMKQVGHHGQIEHSSMHTSFGAPVARIRKGRTSATVMARNASFFSLHHGEVKLLGVQIGSLFMPGVVEMHSLRRTTDGYELGARLEKGYIGPIPAEHLGQSGAAEVSPWYLLPHQHRPRTHVQQHRVTVKIRQQDTLWEIEAASDEPEDVLTQISFFFPRGCSISGEGLVAGEGQVKLWTGGSILCESGKDRMEIMDGQQDHLLWEIRHAESPRGVQTLKVNLLTPFTKTFRIRLY